MYRSPWRTCLESLALPVIADADLEVTVCPFCGDSKSSVVTRAFAPCLVVRCRSCSLSYLSPRWKEGLVRELYSRDDYFEEKGAGYSGYDRQAEALKRTFIQLVRNLERHGLTGGDLLEIGCGYGYLLQAARPFFSTTTGTDYSNLAVDRARAVADAVYRGGLESLPAGRTFDVVILNQVIEHVYRPLSFLKELREWIRPGGRLVLATPDMNSPLRYLLGSRWPSYKIPEHVIYFTEATLSAVLRAAGFVGIGRLPYPHAFPLGLLLEKFHLPRPGRLDRLPIWVPWTTLALYGEKIES